MSVLKRVLELLDIRLLFAQLVVSLIDLLLHVSVIFGTTVQYTVRSATYLMHELELGFE